jgi:uncharacterized protein DUF4129
MSDAGRAQLRAGLLIAIGLVLALAATLVRAPSTSTTPGASLVVSLPDPVRVLVLILLACSTVLLLALQRPRRAGPGEPSAAREYRARSPWMAVISITPFVVFLLVACYLAWYHAPGDEERPIERAMTAIAGLLDFLARTRKAPTTVPLFDVTIAALALSLAAGIFLLMALVTFADRLQRWWTPAPDVTAAEATAPEERLADPRAEPDARRAVITAYRHFERAAATARTPRAAWQTPGEFRRTIAARWPAVTSPVERLTTLFEVARYSDRPLDGTARDVACADLATIAATLTAETTGAR